MIRPFDPMTFPLEADLSRADVRLLHKLCAGKSVVEFGCGGSTVLLANFCARLVSYDTDPSWIARTQKRLEREPGHTCAAIRLCEQGLVPDGLPPAEVYFIDGWVPDRARWVKEVVLQGLTTQIVVHDSRADAMTDLSTAFAYPATLCLRSVEYHVEGSNLVLIRCGVGVRYENWNETEPEHRLPFLAGEP